LHYQRINQSKQKAKKKKILFFFWDLAWAKISSLSENPSRLSEIGLESKGHFRLGDHTLAWAKILSRQGETPLAWAKLDPRAALRFPSDFAWPERKMHKNKQYALHQSYHVCLRWLNWVKIKHIHNELSTLAQIIYSTDQRTINFHTTISYMQHSIQH